MKELFSRVKDIIKEEKCIYERIFEIEEAKTEAIIDRNGRQLEFLSTEQDCLICEIEVFEAERLRLMDEEGCIMNVREIAQKLPDAESAELICDAEKLRDILMTLKNLQNTNENMAADNMEYFNLMVSGMKESSTIRSGYGSDGREQGRVTKPVLLNTRA